MAKDVVLRLSSYASRLCNAHGVKLSGALTTNAYVLDLALFEELLSFDQRFFQITLDGWGEGHDAVRRLANRRGTFERIWGNLCATKATSSDFEILIRIHVRRDNYASVETLVDNIAEVFGGDPRYSLDFEHLRNLGGEGGKSVNLPLSLTELREIEGRMRARFDAAVASMRGTGQPASRSVPPARIGEQKPSDAPGAAPYICYAAKPNSLLIRADGRIGKCTVALNDERNTIGRIGPDGLLAIDSGLLRPWVRGLADLDAQALECPLRGLAPSAVVSA